MTLVSGLSAGEWESTSMSAFFAAMLGDFERSLDIFGCTAQVQKCGDDSSLSPYVTRQLSHFGLNSFNEKYAIVAGKFLSSINPFSTTFCSPSTPQLANCS
jgi:hypothetical protein